MGIGRLRTRASAPGSARGEVPLPSSTHALLHATGRDGGRRAGHGDAGGRVDDGDGVAGAGGGGLVDLDALLVGGRMERRRGRVQREARGDLLGLLRGRGFGGVARQRRALRCAVDGNQLQIGRSVDCGGLSSFRV